MQNFIFYEEVRDFEKAKQALAQNITLKDIPQRVISKWGHVLNGKSYEMKVKLGVIGLVVDWKNEWALEYPNKDSLLERMEELVSDFEKMSPKNAVELATMEEPETLNDYKKFRTERDLYVVRKMIGHLHQQAIPEELTNFINKYEGASTGLERK